MLCHYIATSKQINVKISFFFIHFLEIKIWNIKLLFLWIWEFKKKIILSFKTNWLSSVPGTGSIHKTAQKYLTNILITNIPQHLTNLTNILVESLKCLMNIFKMYYELLTNVLLTTYKCIINNFFLLPFSFR